MLAPRTPTLADAERFAVESAIEAQVPLLVANVMPARERDAGLVVLGPEPQRIGQRRLRRAARIVLDRLDCLVWVRADIDPPTLPNHS